MILLFFINGVFLYLFMLLRIYSVSQGVQKETWKQFPGSNANTDDHLPSLFEAANNMTSLAEEAALGTGDGGDIDTRKGFVEEDERDTHPETIHEQTPRGELIEEANIRLHHIAMKANVVDPRELGLEFKDSHNDGRPAYRDIVDQWGNITQDVSDLLQFAIVGFGKCGTTSIMDWIGEHPSLKCFPEESNDLMKSNPAGLLAKLYTLPSGTIQRGYKSPLDLTMPHITQQIAELFPKTKLIVGIRHPIRWYESLYNFRVQNWNRPEPFPEPHDLIGACRASSHNTCTQKGEFAIFLRNLGLTPTAKASIEGWPRLFDEEKVKQVRFERILHKAAKIKYLKATPLPNPVFLFEINQLHEENATRKKAFRKDLSEFLGLPPDQPLPSDIPHSKPGRQWSPKLQAEKEASKIDICKDEYVDVRRVLLRQARTTALWLRRVMLPTGRVRVSTPEHFDKLLDSWMVDPCGPHELTNTAAKKLLEIFDKDVDNFIPPAKRDGDDDDDDDEPGEVDREDDDEGEQLIDKVML